MVVSSKGRYALRVMVELAAAPQGEYQPLARISEGQGISEKYLEAIFAPLAKAGFVEGQRGKNGGYRLTRPAKDYTVGSILRLTEKTLAPVSCMAEGAPACGRAHQCTTRAMWHGLDKLIISSTHSSTHNNYMYGNAFEALVGAVYLDKGYSYCMRFIGQRIMTRLINIDTVAYKEVNFKSKLIEWGQKKRVGVTFNLIEEDKEDDSSPVFITQVNIEGVTCCTGKGYSKKESQQLAAKDTIALLKKSPKIVENILANKKQREALIEQPAKEEENRVEITPESHIPTLGQTEFDLSDIKISAHARNKEEIVAAAEAAAFQS